MPKFHPLFVLIPAIPLTLGISFLIYTKIISPHGIRSPLVSPIDTTIAPETEPNIVQPPPADTELTNPIPLLLLGMDRRSHSEIGRTDAIILLTISEENRRVVLTSIPRDLWIDGQKINGYFAVSGFPTFQDKIETVTGIRPERYIAVDFDAAVWAIDELGGVEVPIQRSFTDTGYPADRPNCTVPPSFEAGLQKLDGEAALSYSRSRKGTNGEGSDFQRMRRQQNLLKSLPEAFTKSSLAELAIEALYNLLTGHIETNLGVGDCAKLLELFRNYQDYQVEQIVLDTENFLYHPDSGNYGGAYVLRPNNDDFAPIHQAVNGALEGITAEETSAPAETGIIGEP